MVAVRAPRSMKIVIANNRAATQPPPDFLAGSRGTARGRGGANGSAPMVLDNSYRQVRL